MRVQNQQLLLVRLLHIVFYLLVTAAEECCIDCPHWCTVEEGENSDNMGWKLDCVTSEPCQHDGRCVDDSDNDATTCECAAQWTGAYCEQEILAFDGNSSDYSAAAEADECLGPDCNTALPASSASCDGTTCTAHEADHCATLRPCHNAGTCLNAPQHSYTCLCSQDFTGPACEIQLSAYLTATTSAAFDLGDDLDLTQISLAISAAEPSRSGAIFSIESTVNMSLSIFNGRLELSVHVTSGDVILTSDPVFTTSDDPVSVIEARWSHRINVDVDQNNIALTVVNKTGHVVCTEASHVAGLLQVHGPGSFHLGQPYVNNSFHGCIHNLTLNNELISFDRLVAVNQSRLPRALCPANTDCLPCQHAGRCAWLSDGRVQCLCPTGASGTQCQVDVDECLSEPCQNGGQCTTTELLGSYECECEPFWTGDNCSQSLNDTECQDAEDFCRNNGTCEYDVITGLHRCNCTGTGYTGTSCELDVNECKVGGGHRCSENSTCVNVAGSYWCDCQPSFTGRYCETELLVGTVPAVLIAMATVVFCLAALVLVLVVLLLRVRMRRQQTGVYRPSSVEHKAGTLPLPTVSGSSVPTSRLHLVLGTATREILV